MLLITFIESAFKYGLSNDQQGPIKINLTLADEELLLEVSNPIVSNSAPVPGTGNGLSLTRKRLELLYPAKHQLEISTQQHIYHVKLSLKLY